MRYKWTLCSLRWCIVTFGLATPAFCLFVFFVFPFSGRVVAWVLWRQTKVNITFLSDPAWTWASTCLVHRETNLMQREHTATRFVLTPAKFTCGIKVGRHEGTSLCDWSLQQVAGTSSIVWTSHFCHKIFSRELKFGPWDYSHEFKLVWIFGTSPCDLFLKTLRVNCSWDKSLRPN